MELMTAIGPDVHRSILPTNLSAPLAEVHWFAVYISANHEKKVAAELDRRSIECFLPLYHSVRRWKDRRVKLDLPLFPGYVFGHFALPERLRILQIPGVVRLVGFGNCPAAVPEIEICRIRRVLNQDLRIEPHPYLTVGRHVLVKAGPLAGLEGILTRRKNRLRFVVSVELIMRSIAAEIDEADIEPI
jgi:transcription antitermination factor NusG